jgi:hypothetical protein
VPLGREGVDPYGNSANATDARAVRRNIKTPYFIPRFLFLPEIHQKESSFTRIYTQFGRIPSRCGNRVTVSKVERSPHIVLLRKCHSGDLSAGHLCGFLERTVRTDIVQPVLVGVQTPQGNFGIEPWYS